MTTETTTNETQWPVADSENPEILLLGRLDTLESTETSYLQSSPNDADIKERHGHIYALSGDELGEFIADESNSFSVPVKSDILRAIADRSSRNTIPIVVVENDGLQLYADIPASVAGEINIGTADAASTLATLGISRDIPDFAGWGADYADAQQGTVDLTCLYSLHHGLWNNAGEKDFGLGRQIASFKEDAALSLNDASNANFEYSLEQDPTLELLDEILETYIEDDDGAVLCAEMASGEVAPETVVGPLLVAENLGELTDLYSDRSAIDLHKELILHCQQNRSCDYLAQEAETVLGILLSGENPEWDKIDSYGGNQDGSKNANTDAAVDAEPKKIVICHLPPGNPANAHAISIALSAWDAHLAHGDSIGACAFLAGQTPTANSFHDSDVSPREQEQEMPSYPAVQVFAPFSETEAPDDFGTPNEILAHDERSDVPENSPALPEQDAATLPGPVLQNESPSHDREDGSESPQDATEPEISWEPRASTCGIPMPFQVTFGTGPVCATSINPDGLIMGCSILK